jgi:hypothetical protein
MCGSWCCRVRRRNSTDGRTAYEDGYCPRGDAENRIKEQKCLFAGSLPCEQMRANQIRLYQCSFAYVLCMPLRRYGLAGTEMSQAQCPTCASVCSRLAVWSA